jgi:translation initiation factor IF-1
MAGISIRTRIFVLAVGDRVTVEINPHVPSHGRIVARGSRPQPPKT